MRFSAIYYVDIDRNALTLKERLLKTLYMLSFSHGKRITDGQDIVLIWLNGIGGMLME